MNLCPTDHNDLATTDRPLPPTTSRWRGPILFCIWVALIFGTSCTVIRPDEFFQLVARFTGAEQASMQKFALFWGLSWFTIVKGWHVTEFFMLTLFTVSAVKWCGFGVTARSIAGSMLFCILFAASDEWHQTFVPDRFGTVQDVLIDSAGVCAAGLTLLLRLRREQRYPKKI